MPSKYKLLCQCACGAQRRVRVKDLLYGTSSRCRRCADKDMANGKERPNEELRRIGALGVAAKRRRRAEAWMPHALSDVRSVRLTMRSASARCNNPHDTAYKNYGGRGIKFMFSAPLDATRWVLDNLGPKPSPEHSIDRIDNSRHYEPGNLRWATREEQARNKRQYKRTPQGEVIRRVLRFRHDVTYECVRNWLKQGLSEEQILSKRKYASTSL